MTEFFNNFFPLLLTGAEIFIAVFVAVWQLKGRSIFPLRVALSALGLIASAFLFCFLFFCTENVDVILHTAYYLFLCVAAFLTAFFCFRVENIKGFIFRVNIALAARFSAVKIGGTINFLLVNNALISDGVAEYVINLAVLLTVYIFVYFIFIQTYKTNIEQYVGVSSVIMLPVFLLITVILEWSEQFIIGYGSSNFIIVGISGILYGIVILFIEYAFLYQGQSEVEISIVKSLWEEDRKHYTIQKENMDIINIKCHDLRHQLHGIRKSGNINEKAIKEIEKSIYIYDSIMETNNEVLDVILSSFSLRCQKNNVLLTCMVDGEKLDFMDEFDVYSLFGNMLENALEYEQTVQPVKNRFITLTIKETRGFLSIQVKNYYLGKMNFVGGLPSTSKQDKNYHGFGMKSMQRIVEKYAGRFDVVTADNMFQVKILLPLPNVFSSEKDQEDSKL